MKNKTYYVLTKVLFLLTFWSTFGCSTAKFNKEIVDYRSTYKNNFNTDSHAPLKGPQLDSMQFFKANMDFRFLSNVQLLKDGIKTIVPTSSGKLKAFKEYAIITFSDSQKKVHKLTVYQNQKTIKIPKYKDYLFLPFNDDTNGVSTYGGGRYIDIKIQDIKNNKLILDFNKAYNPYCHYSAGYNCPIPPPNNYLDMEILAGEKLWIGTYIGNNEH